MSDGGTGPGTLQSNDFTYEYWRKGLCTDAGGEASQPGFFMFGDQTSGPCYGVRFLFTSGSSTDLTVPGTVASAPALFADKGVHHFVITKNSAAVTLYVDGRVKASSTTVGTTLTATPGGLNIMGNASIDAVAKYDKALTPTQVVAHYISAVAVSIAHTFGTAIAYAGYVDDPVNTATGNATVVAPLVGQYPGHVFGMSLNATYNQLDPSNVSVLGLPTGWSSPLDSALTPLADGSLVWRGDDGHTVRVLSTGTNRWAAPEGMLGTIRSDGATPARYVLQLQSGERWEYDPVGRIARRCQGVADWATRADWTASSTAWTAASDWCGTAGTGQYVTVAWSTNAGTQPTTVTSSTGMAQTFTYDAAHRLVQVRADDDGVAADYRYVTLGYSTAAPTVVTWVSAPHFSSELGTASVAPTYPFELFSADSFGRVTAVATTAGQYTAGGDIPDSSKATTEVANVYDTATGRVTAQTNKIGNTTTFDWADATGSVQAKAAMPGSTFETVTYSHDGYGHVTSIQDPNTNTAAKVWSQGTAAQVPSATPTQETDRLGTMSAAAYDALGRLAGRATPDATTGFVPPLADQAGSETCKRAADGSFPAPTSAACNVTGKRFGLATYTYLNGTDSRVDTYTDAVGQKTKFTYTGTSVYPATVTTGCQTYTTSCSSGDASAPAVTTSYTYVGNQVTSVTDGAGVKNCTAYTTYGQVAFTTPAVTGACPTSAASTSTVYTYTALGQPRTVTKPPVPPATVPAVWTYTYFGTGQPKTVADPIAGHDPITYSYTYGAQSFVTTVSDELDQVTTTTTTWKVTDQTVCDGGIAGTAGYDPDGQPVFLPCQTTTTQAPSPAAPVTAIADANGQARLTATPVGAGGARAWTEYGNLGRVTKSFDPDGVVTQFSYDANGRVTGRQAGAETGAAGTAATATTVFDRRGRVTSQATAMNDAGPVTTKFAYDQNDRVIQQVSAAPDGTFPAATDGVYPAPTEAGNNWTLQTTTYAPTGAVKQTAGYRNDTPAGPGTTATVAHVYDAAGRTNCVDTRVVAAGGGGTETHTYQATDYDPATGYAARTRVPIGAVTGCTDHVSGAVPDPAYWAVTASAYNTDGSVNWQQNPGQYAAHPTVDAGHPNYRTTFGYDPVGRRITTQAPDPAHPGTATVTATTCYTARGEVRAQITPNGAGVSVVRTDYYPANGLARYVADPTAGYTATTGCAADPQSAPTAGVTQFGYDGRGNRTSRQTLADGGTGVWLAAEGWTYDLANRPTGYTSNTGTAIVATATTYTIAAGRLTGQTTTTGATADASVRRLLTSYAPSGAVRTTEADLCGSDLTCSAVANDADHKTITTTTYDPLGRKATVADTSPGITTNNTYSFAYNTAGNITQVTYPNSATLTASWNLTGQPTGQTYPSGTAYRYRYDPRLALQNVDLSYAGTWVNLAAYTSDANGARTREVLTGATSSERNWTRNAATGTVDKYTQVLAGTTAITTPVTYDNAGRVATDCQGTGSGGACQATDRKTSYSYDPAGQLLSAAIANDTTSGDIVRWDYTYGNHGNRITQTVTTNGSGAAVTNYRYDPIQTLCATKVGANPSSCTDTNATRYTFDGAGRLTATTPASGLATTIGYDAAGREASIATSGSPTEYHGYDPLGQWNCYTTTSGGCARTPTTGNNFFYWDNTGGGVPQIIVWTSVGTTDYRYVYGGERISLWGYYFSNDYLGSVLAGPGDSSGPTNYSPLGEPIGATINGGFRYRGELYGNNQLYLRARNYQPTTGTFTTRDPLDGVAGTTVVANAYHYSNNDPINLEDPSGLRPSDYDASFSLVSFQQAGCAGTACHWNPYNRGLIDGQYRVMDLTPCETGGDRLGPSVGSPFPVIGSTFGFCGPTANGLPAGFRQPASQLWLSWSGRVMVKNYETRQQWAYDDDGARSCTIGYGHLIARAGVSCASLGIAGSTRGPVGPQCNDVTTSTRCEFMMNAQVDQLFDADVFQRDRHMHSVLGNIPLSQFEYDAIFQLVWAQPGWADPVVNALKSMHAKGDLGPNRSDAEVDAAYASLARLVRYPGTVLPQRSAAIQRLWTGNVYTHGQA